MNVMEQDQYREWRDSICNPAPRYPSRPAPLSDYDVDTVAAAVVAFTVLWALGCFEK